MKKIILLFTLLIPFISNSQCVSDGPRNASSFSNNNSIGTLSWNNLSNIISSDNARSSAGFLIGLLSPTSTNYFLATNFGFNVPSTSNICGIEVMIERKAQGLALLSSITDNEVKIVKAGIITGNNYNINSNWTGSDINVTYGANNDNWGETWTPNDINSSNFGIAISASLIPGLAAIGFSAQIDHIEITVHYESTLPVEIINFTGERINNNQVNLKWTTSSEVNNDYFTIERSTDMINWEAQENITGIGNSSTNINYSFIDNNNSSFTSYYRLKQTDFNGEHSYHKTIAIPPSTNPNTTTIYPNPSNGLININDENTILKIEVINLLGNIIYSESKNNKNLTIDLSSYPREIYFIKTYTKNTVNTNKIILD